VHGIGEASALRSHEGRVYHYTSAAGLLGIVSSGMLRASEASSLNDLAEVELGWRAINEWLTKQKKTAGVTYLKSHIRGSRMDPKHQVFILSGTTVGDDANQWRLYADRGRGYALALDGSVPLGVVSQDPEEDKKGGRSYGRVTEFVYLFPWHRVLYTRKHLHRALEALVNYIESELGKVNALSHPEDQEHAAQRLVDKTSEELALIAHLSKTAGFSGEHEVRVVARFMWYGKHVGFRAGAYGIAGHVHLVRADGYEGSLRRVVPAPSMEDRTALDFLHPVPVTHVRLGPLVHSGNRETVEAFLAANGLSTVKVRRSTVPLR
jgi:Protein of unknown function (DUF2971)